MEIQFKQIQHCDLYLFITYDFSICEFLSIPELVPGQVKSGS